MARLSGASTLVVAMVLPLFAPGGVVAEVLPSCGAAAADPSNPHWRDPTYLNCSDTFWGCTESGLPGNQATEDDPYCEPCSHAWDVEDDWDAYVRGYEAGNAVGFESGSEAASDDAEEAKEDCFDLATDSLVAAGAIAATGTILSVTGIGTGIGAFFMVWGAFEALEGSAIYFYCRIKHD
ncbi:MAG: hypothetical protein OXT64_18775 [Gammaproteobacteria bacterium]|nr:hypothetical protein [Gammaproteobacteria bacterium]